MQIGNVLQVVPTTEVPPAPPAPSEPVREEAVAVPLVQEAPVIGGVSDLIESPSSPPPPPPDTIVSSVEQHQLQMSPNQRLDHPLPHSGKSL